MRPAGRVPEDRCMTSSTDTLPARPAGPPAPALVRLHPAELERRLEAYLLIARRIGAAPARQA